MAQEINNLLARQNFSQAATLDPGILATNQLQSEDDEYTEEYDEFTEDRETSRQQELLIAKLTKLKKQAGKYKHSTFIALTLVAAFVDIVDIFINILFATIILAPIGLVFWIAKQLGSAFIWIKIHNIIVDQETGENFINTTGAILAEMTPFISALPITTVRVFKAWFSAHNKFKQRSDEIKQVQKQIIELEN